MGNSLRIELVLLALFFIPVSFNADAALLLTESFDDGALNTRGWYDNGATSQDVVYDTDRAGRVLEVVYPAGSNVATGGSLRHLFDETETIYFEYYVKYASNWSWTGKNYGPHEFYFLTNADHNYKGPAHSHGTFYVEIVNGIPRVAIQDSMNIDIDYINQDLTHITEDRAVAGCNGSTDGYTGTCYQSNGIWFNGKMWGPNISPIQNNRWYQISVYLRMNGVVNGKGVANGELKYWLDGQLLLSLDNILFRTGSQTDLKFNQILFGPYFHNGAPQTQKFWVDDILIQSTIPQGKTNKYPPSPPKNLSVVKS